MFVELPTIPHPYHPDTHYKVETALRVTSPNWPTPREFGVIGWTAAGEDRLVYQGPMVPGPMAVAFAHAVVLSAHYVEPRPAVDVYMGDHVVIDGVDYVIEPDHNRNIKLVRA